MGVKVRVLSDFLENELEGFDRHFFTDKGKKGDLSLFGVPRG